MVIRVARPVAIFAQVVPALQISALLGVANMSDDETSEADDVFEMFGPVAKNLGSSPPRPEHGKHGHFIFSKLSWAYPAPLDGWGPITVHIT